MLLETSASLLVAKGLTTRSKDANRSSWPYSHPPERAFASSEPCLPYASCDALVSSSFLLLLVRHLLLLAMHLLLDVSDLTSQKV